MSTPSKAFYINTGETDCWEVYSDVNKRIAICDKREDASHILKMLNQEIRNNNKIPDPYAGPPDMTDCELWSVDITQILKRLFKNQSLQEGDFEAQDLKDATESLQQALVWFYQTHL
jgi:hypothetical protein